MVPGMIVGWALLFVLIAGEITASSMLAGTRNPVIGFVVLDLWGQWVILAAGRLRHTYQLGDERGRADRASDKSAAKVTDPVCRLPPCRSAICQSRAAPT